jgi:hypothetical protein
MIWHLVLLKPRPDLDAGERRAFTEAFRRAVTEIPTVRGVRIARRMTHGAGYEQSAPDAADYLAVIEFDDRAGLETYLSHPAHDELGVRFGRSLSAAMVYDFELLGDGTDIPASLERLIGGA